MKKKTTTKERRYRPMMKSTYDQPCVEFVEFPERSILCSSVDIPLLGENETPFVIYL